MALNKDLVFSIKVDSKGVINAIKTIDRAVDNLGDSASETSTDVKKLNNAIKKTGKDASSFSKTFEKMKMNIISVNQAFELTTRVLGFLTRGFGGASNSAKEFGTSIAEINTLLTDSEIANAGVAKQVENLSILYGKEAPETARAFYQAVSSGATKAAEATNLLGAAGKLAVGGLTPLNKATDVLTTFLNAYEMETTESLRVTDALFLAMKQGKTTIGELSSFISNIVPIANSLGVSMEELLASISAVTIDGTLTAQAVTQLRSAMNGLSKQTPELTRVLRKLGVETVKSGIQTRGFTQLLNDIIGETDGTTESLNKLFGRVEAITGILTLTGAAADKFTETMELMKEASEDTGKVTERAFQIIAERDKFRSDVAMRRLEKSVRAVGRAFNKIWIPTLELASKAFQTFINSFNIIDEIVSDVNLLTTAIISLSVAFYQLSAAAGSSAIVSSLGKIKILAVALLAQFKILIPIIKTATLGFAQFALVTAGITTVVVAIDFLVRNLMDLPKVVTLVAKVFELSFKNILFVFRSLKLDLIEFLSQFPKITSVSQREVRIAAEEFSALGDNIVGVREEVEELSKGLDTGIGGKIASIIGKYTNSLDKVSTEQKKVAKTAKEMGDAITKALSPEQETALLALQKQTAELQAEAAAFGKSEIEIISLQVAFEKQKLDILKDELILKGEMSKAAQKEIDKQKELLDIIGSQKKGEAVKKSSGQIGEVFGNVQGIATKLGEATGNSFISSIGTEMSSIAGSAGAAMAGPIADVIMKIPEILDSFTSLFNAITDLPKNIATAVSDLFGSIVNLVKDFLPNIVNMFKDILMSIADVITDLPDAFMEMMSEGLPAAFESFIDKLPEIVQKFVQGIITLIPKIVVAIIKFFIKGMPRIIKAIFNAIPEIIKAIFVGILEAFKEIGKMIGELFGVEFDKKVTEIVESVAKASEDAFAVLEMETAEDLGTMISDAAKDAVDWLGMWWSKFVDLLQILWDNTFGKLGKFLNQWMIDVWDKIEDIWAKTFGQLSMGGLWTTLEDVWAKTFGLLSVENLKKLGTSIFEGLKEGLATIGTWFTDRGKEIWQGLSDGLATLVTWFTDKGKEIWEGLNQGLDALGTWFTDKGTEIWHGLISGLSSLGDWFKDRGKEIWEGFKDAFNIKGLPGSGGGGSSVSINTVVDTVSSWFAKGGAIPYHNVTPISKNVNVKGYATGGGVDDQIIGAQSGEFMMSRVGRATLGDSTLNAANEGRNITGDSGKQVVNNNTFEFKVNVQGSTTDPAKMAEKVFDRIKRESIRGRFVVDTKGIRNV